MSTTDSVPGASDPPTFAEIREVLRQVARQQRETALQMKETALQMKETDRRLKRAETRCRRRRLGIAGRRPTFSPHALRELSPFFGWPHPAAITVR